MGPENTRPIAIGETLRRLTGKCLLRARRAVMERRALTIRNFAFTSDGCSNVVKLAKQVTRRRTRNKETYKHGKYDEAAAAAGVLFIPFAVETYGKMGKEALRMLRTMQQDSADSSPPSALRPWHARTFVDSAVQRLSVALQRSIQRDQILRSHLHCGVGRAATTLRPTATTTAAATAAMRVALPPPLLRTAAAAIRGLANPITHYGCDLSFSVKSEWRGRQYASSATPAGRNGLQRGV